MGVDRLASQQEATDSDKTLTGIFEPRCVQTKVHLEQPPADLGQRESCMSTYDRFGKAGSPSLSESEQRVEEAEEAENTDTHQDLKSATAKTNSRRRTEELHKH